MKLKNIPDIVQFSNAISQCKGSVYLTSNTVDADGNYDLCINLKSGLSFYLGIAQLIEDEHDNLEIHCSQKDDEAIIIDFLNSLGND